MMWLIWYQRQQPSKVPFTKHNGPFTCSDLDKLDKSASKVTDVGSISVYVGIIILTQKKKTRITNPLLVLTIICRPMQHQEIKPQNRLLFNISQPLLV